MKYKWGKDTARHPWWRLRPENSPDWHMLNSIAVVRPITDSAEKRRYHASYNWPISTGNKPESWAILGTVPGARKWAERELAKFWDSPEIVT